MIEIKEVLKKYIEEHDKLTKEFHEKKAYTEANYIGEVYASKISKFTQEYNSAINAIKSAAREKIEGKINDTTSKVTAAAMNDMGAEVVRDMELLKKVNLGEREFNLLIDKYKNSYFASKLLKGMAKEKNISMDFVDMEEVIGDIDFVKDKSLDLISNYKQPISYMHRLIIQADLIEKTATSANNFIKKYE